MKDIIQRLEKDFAKYTLFVEVLSSLSTADETKRSIYYYITEAKDKFDRIDDKDVSEFYRRVVEDLRSSVHQSILDSDYRRLLAHLITKADDLGQKISSEIQELKKS